MPLDLAREPFGADELVARARAGEPRATARLISLVEADASSRSAVLAALGELVPAAHVVGITGGAGVGKSTLVAALVRRHRSEGRRVAVLAVDPSSTRTGGALLGDRIRMQQHATDPGVYIRSVATRGRLGGLAWTTGLAVRVLTTVGFDVVLIETTGTGQTEIDVADVCDSTVVVLTPTSGDFVQVEKAGLLEVADIVVVNQSDRPGADTMVRNVRAALGASATPGGGPAGGVDTRAPQAWRRPVLRATASRGEGIADLARALAEHRTWLAAGPAFAQGQVRRARAEIQGLLARRRWEAERAEAQAGCLDALAGSVVAGELDAQAAADLLGEQPR